LIKLILLYFSFLFRIGTGSSLRLTGNFVISKGKGQALDFIVKHIDVLGETDSQVIDSNIEGKNKKINN